MNTPDKNRKKAGGDSLPPRIHLKDLPSPEAAWLLSILKSGKFKLDKADLPPEMVRWVEGYEEKIREELTAAGLDKLTATREDLARLSGILLGALENYSREFTRRFKELERLKRKLLPARAAVPGDYLDQIFFTEKTARKLADDPATKTALVKSKIEWAIANKQIGLGLNVTEQRVLQGLFALNTNNQTPGILTLHIEDLYRACGATCRGDRRNVYKTFFRLWDKNFYMIGRVVTGYDKKTKEKITETNIQREPLYKLNLRYRNIKEGTIEEVVERIHDPEQHQLLEITLAFNRLLFQDLAYWRLVDTDLYHQIRRVLLPGERISKYDYNYILWLHRHALGTRKRETNEEALAEELGMVEYLRPRKRPKEIEETLLRCYRIADALGYHSRPARHRAPAKKKSHKEVIYINPEKVSTARQEVLPGILEDGNGTENTPQTKVSKPAD